MATADEQVHLVPRGRPQARPLWVAGWVARPRFRANYGRKLLINNGLFVMPGLYDIVLM